MKKRKKKKKPRFFFGRVFLRERVK